MCEPPATIACTSVNTLRPGRAPPTRPTRRTVGVDQRFQPEPIRQRRHQQQPGVGDQIRVVEGGLDAVDARAILASLKVPPGLVDDAA